MNPLLEQFLSEARDFLQSIGERLLQLEADPGQGALIDELFRLVHTLKGNSGLFDLPELTRVLHAAEDLMDRVREGRLDFSRALADQLLEAMDFVAALIDEIAATSADGQPPNTSRHAAQAARLGEQLHALMGGQAPAIQAAAATPTSPAVCAEVAPAERPPEAVDARLAGVPESFRMALYRRLRAGEPFCWLLYRPEEECFFKGEDPFFQVAQLTAPVWRRLGAHEDWPRLVELDAYRCVLTFELILNATAESLLEHFRYVADQVEILPLDPAMLILPAGRTQEEAVAADFARAALDHLDAGRPGALAQAARTLLELSAPDLWIASALRWLLLVLELEPDAVELQRSLIAGIRRGRIEDPATPSTPVAPAVARTLDPERVRSCALILQAQAAILDLTDRPDWLPGRLGAVAASLAGVFTCLGLAFDRAALARALSDSIAAGSSAALRDWLGRQALPAMTEVAAPAQAQAQAGVAATAASPVPAAAAVPAADEEPVRFGRRAEDQLASPRTLKVEQVKIDRLMNLIGEMVVAKNALPYLAGRAEQVFGVRELAREIKSQYSVINRIAEEMQDAIMQVRMLPVSFVFQRFPRLVRDLAHKLGKEVRLVMEGESTEADKNIIEALADPLVHIVRNSLDHGLETPAERRAAGKPPEGRLTIGARQEADRVLIEIADDGRGIDPAVIRRKAYAKGLIDEAALERLSDQEAVNLVFAAGFSTAEQVTDVSGRGVGMDVVRNAIARVNGAIELHSQVGQGTRLRLSLPLSMAVTNVMIIASAGQRFGVPMDAVVETVRVAQRDIRTIKRRTATVLRGRLVPLVALNELLALDTPQRCNDDQEFAVLVVRIEQEHLGIIVDDCRETVDIILKPLSGLLAGLAGYAGSALLGDGSVLLVLDPRGLL